MTASLRLAAAMLAIAGCSAEAPDSDGVEHLSGPDSTQDPRSVAAFGPQRRFSVADSLGGGFDSESTGARIGWAYASMVDLRAEGVRISVDGRGLPDAGAASTVTLGFNNTTYSRVVRFDGPARSVICKPGDPVEGVFERTRLEDGRISGRFEVVFERCSDGTTGQPVPLPGLPLTVSGSFEDLPLSG
ncbi:hypothetical protein [Halomonas denitrificans]|nr:hypothetical protein [Halomonas denitrificans]